MRKKRIILPKFKNGTDSITNSINQDLINVVTYPADVLLSKPDVQKLVDQYKAEYSPFMVDDYYYRAKRTNPELTKQQVLDVYNNTPAVALTYGGYDPQYEGGSYHEFQNDRPSTSGYIKIFDNTATNIPLLQKIWHEYGHAYDDKLFNVYSKDNDQIYPTEEIKDLQDAYLGIPGKFANNFGLEFQIEDEHGIKRWSKNDPEIRGDIKEMKLLNRSLRGQIRDLNNGVIEGGLDEAIKNTSDDDVFEVLGNGRAEYVNGGEEFLQWLLNLKKDKEKYKKKADAIRRAMLLYAMQKPLHTPVMNDQYEMA